MPNKKTSATKFILITKEGKLFGKYDLFLPLFIIIILTLGFFISRVLLQKEEFITAELFASGGEWWWNNPEPPHWLVDPMVVGAKEYDPQGNVLVEVLDTRKFEVGQRKMLWMKVKLRVTPSDKAKQYRFRREPLQVGSLIYVAPNNVKIFSNVMWIEGVDQTRVESQKTVTLKEYDIFPWTAEAIKVGDTMKSDDGKVLAEVLEVSSVDSETTTVDDQGSIHVRSNPTRRDITIKVRLATTQSNGLDYFSYFQPLKIGFYMWVPLPHINMSGNIVAVE